MCNLEEKLLNTIFYPFSQAVSIHGAKILKSYWTSTEIKYILQGDLKILYLLKKPQILE